MLVLTLSVSVLMAPVKSASVFVKVPMMDILVSPLEARATTIVASMEIV
jgi:hypothetical protein